MRRRKPRVVWLPNTNANSIATTAPLEPTSTAQIFAVDVSGDQGNFAAGEIPIVIDETPDPLVNVDSTLSDIFNSGYRLRRIVGKIFIGIRQTPERAPPRVLVTAGLIVRRTQTSTGQSLALLSGDAELIAPGDIENASDPWIWRRAWILRNRASLDDATDIDFRDAPTTNLGLGALAGMDGPHVDVKTARRIGPEERLFLNVQSTILAESTEPQINTVTIVIADLRVLASLSTSVGNRRNASR